MPIPSVIASWKPIKVADYFVVKANKLTTRKGNGENVLYVGAEGSELSAFFGATRIGLAGFVHRRCLLDLLDSLKDQYQVGFARFRGDKTLPRLWVKRRNELLALQDAPLRFQFSHASHRAGERVFISSGDPAWDFLQSIPLSGSAWIQIEKIAVGKSSEFRFRLIPIAGPTTSISGTRLDRQLESKEIAAIRREPIAVTERETLILARRGQGRFRQELMARGAICLVSGTTTPSMLIASHIKEWARCSNTERLDPFNGILLSPSLDRLFDLKLATIDSATEEFVVSSEILDVDLSALGIQRRQPLTQRGIVNHARMKVYIADHNSRYRP